MNWLRQIFNRISNRFRNNTAYNTLPTTPKTNESPKHTASVSEIISKLAALILARDNMLNIMGAGILTGASTGLNFLGPFLLGETIRLHSGQDEKMDVLGVELSREQLTALFIVAASLAQIFPLLRDQLMVAVTEMNTKKVLKQSTEHLLKKSLNYQVNTQFPDQIYFIQKGFALSTIGTPLLTQIAPTVAEIAIAATVLINRYGLAGTGIFGVLALYAIYGAITARPIVHSREESLKRGNEAYENFTNAITRYKSMRDFGKHDFTMAGVETALNNMMNASIYASQLPIKIGLGHILIARLMMLLVALSVSAGIKTEQYSVQEFIVLLGYLNQLSSLLPPFGQAINQLFAAYPDLKFVFGELANGHEIVDEHPNIPLPVVPGVAPLIEFKNVSFTYPPKKDEKIGLTVFKDLSFTVKPGETVAFVSASGAGKTTIFNLLYGYYKPNQGVIKINGKDISEVSLTSLQKNINLFSQTPDLFKGSIRDNILFGAENPTTITDEMIDNTAKAVDLYDFLQAFPDKLATDVGSEGKAISLGQRQKVSVLRGLMKQGVIRLLDEITAPFDNSSAQAVLQNLAKPSGVTTLMITHKLHEAQHVDKIFVLEDGRVVAEGTHQELLETSPHYQKLWADGNHDAEPMRSSSMSKITQALGGPVAQVQTSLATNSNSVPVNPTPKPISSSIDDDNDEYYFADKIALRR